MKLKAIFLSAALCMGAAAADAQSLGDLLKGVGGGGDISSTIGNVIEGVFTKTNLEVADLVGEYVSAGPAVTFKSDNFLEKAGGLAGAAALETKLQPYYEQYGLNGMPLVIDADASFTMTVMRIKLTGIVEKGSEEGTFRFNLMMGGKMKIGTFTAYVEKSGKNLNLMFDATKLKEIISTVSKFSGMKMASALGSILDSYDGACVGFKMQYTGEAGTSPATGSTEAISGSGSSEQPAGSAVESLRDLLNSKKKK